MTNGELAPMIGLVRDGGLMGVVSVLLWAVIFKLPKDMERIVDKLAGSIERQTERHREDHERSAERVLEEVRRARRELREGADA